MNFPEGSICSSNRHEFSRGVYMFFEQTRIFQEGYSKRHVFSRRFYLFVEQTLLSHRTDTNFPRNPYLVLEHIQIFQEALYSPRTPTIFQETLSSPRTHTIFQETPMPRTHRHFPGRYPLSNRYFVNRSRWLLSFFYTPLLEFGHFFKRSWYFSGFVCFFMISRKLFPCAFFIGFKGFLCSFLGIFFAVILIFDLFDDWLWSAHSKEIFKKMYKG